MFDLDTINGLFGDAVTVADGRVTVSRPAVLAGTQGEGLARRRHRLAKYSILLQAVCSLGRRLLLEHT